MSSYYRNTFIGFTETSVILQFAQLRIESRHMKHTNNILLLDLLNKDFTIYSNVSRIDSKRKTDDKIKIKFLLFIIQLLMTSDCYHFCYNLKSHRVMVNI